MQTTLSDPADRVATGKAARERVPRARHADWAPAPDRPDPRELLASEDATRVPELVPIRYGRMLVSPFTLYRGAAAITVADLAGTPVSGVDVQRVAISAYLGGGSQFERALPAFAETYADQNERDHAALCAAVEAGEIEARSDL